MEPSLSAERSDSNVSCNNTVNSTFLDECYGDGELVYLCDGEPNIESISAAFFIIIFILSLIGNGLLLCILICYEDLKVVTNLFLLNLAFSDLIFSSTFPFWATNISSHWVFGDFACKFLVAAFSIGLFSGVILLTAMTLDRFIKVVMQKWLGNPRKRLWCAVAACAAAWLISIVASVGEAVNSKMLTLKEYEEDFYTCDTISTELRSTGDTVVYYLEIALLFFLPFVFIIACYSAILRTIMVTVSKKKQRTVLFVLYIVVAFFICWAPYHTLTIVLMIYEPKSCVGQYILQLAFHISQILAFSHCCMNPMICMLSRNFQKHLLHLLHCGNIGRKERGRDGTPLQLVTLTQTPAV